MGRKVDSSRRTGGGERRFGVPLARTALSLLIAMLAVMVVAAVADADPRDRDLSGAEWTDYDQQPLRVNIWHDKDEGDVYRRGEAVRVHFETNQDAYAVVYRIDAEGEVQVLWPRSRMGDGFVFGGHTYNLPAPGAARIRASGEDGVEYIEAVVSLYPFDLRTLDIDFHHEREDVARKFFVAGDPFLAMNEVNHEITGLDDPADFVATNYSSYYVGRQVAHPRYMCNQCHDADMGHRPYRDECSVTIRYDYGWDNAWYASFGYYPLYYYPTYYYVDPWTGRPWVNYWYRPWYSWPAWNVYSWDWYFYDWRYSPYWGGDVWVRYKDGHRHYRPLSKDVRYKSVAKGSLYSTPPGMFKSKAGKPTSVMESAMRSKTVVDRPAGKVPSDVVRSTAKSKTTVYRNLERQQRAPAVISRPDAVKSKAGLRLPPGDRLRSVTGRKSTVAPGGSDRSSSVRLKPLPKGSDSGDPTVKSRTWSKTGDSSRRSTRVQPVQPNKQGSRIWRGTGSSAGSGAKDSYRKSTGEAGSGKTGGAIRSGKSGSSAPVRSAPKITPKSRGGSSPQKRPTPPPKSSSGGKSGGSKKSAGSSGAKRR